MGDDEGMGTAKPRKNTGRSRRRTPAKASTAKTPAAPKDWGPAVRRAEAALRRSTAAIEAGNTTGTKRTTKQGAPSKYGGARNS